MNALLVLLRVSGLGLLAALLTASRYKVEGFSMEPSYRHGYHYLVDRSVYRRKPPERGHVVVLTHPSLDGKALLKRVVGLPGERVSLTNSRVLINGELLNEPYLSSPGGANPLWDLEWVLGQDECFVLGDNRSNSLDSRRLGPVKGDCIVGKVWFRYWPILG